MENHKQFSDLCAVLRAGYIKSMYLKERNGVLGDVVCYHITFRDGTQHDFYDFEDIVRFANCLFHFYSDKD